MSQAIIIIVFGIIIIYACLGYKKGMFRILFSLISMVLTILACVFFEPAICRYLQENTNLYDRLEKSVYSLVSDNQKYNETFDESVPQIPDDISVGTEEYNEKIGQYYAVIADKLNLPGNDVENKGLLSVKDTQYLLENEKNSIKNSVALLAARRISQIAFNCLIFILIFVVVSIIMKIISAFTGILNSLPLIGQADRILGLAAGTLKGVILVWILFAVLTALSGMEIPSQMLASVKDSAVLTYIYDHDPIIGFFANIL